MSPTATAQDSTPYATDRFPSLREAIARDHRRAEAELMPRLMSEARLPADRLDAAQAVALRLAQRVRATRHRAGGVDALMLEFSLDSREGVALMCLAEALLRIPDAPTRDRLIRDKIGGGDWTAHLGRSPSLFVNAAAWGLLVTGRLVDSRSEGALEQALSSLLRKGGEPLIRKGVDLAMRLLGRQFVLGRTITEAIANGRERAAAGYRFSFDMLGEAALTGPDAERYFTAYLAAVEAIGAAADGAGIYAGPGISIKLSALHPRYVRAQRDRVLAELLPRVIAIARRARHHDIGCNIDAEEADRLDLSLDIFAALVAEPTLAGWDGLGFVVQAYQKRARATIDWLVALARAAGRRVMLRLVKGAYWDGEIKRAQVDGMPDYPVFTRKVHTDVSYLACARAMLAAPDALFPQFATHNAFTIAAVHALAGDADYEFQCLHGMGESIYDEVLGPGPAGLGRPCRIYAPVGSHETLLAYLVRRLLENGANTSFVNRIVDPAVPVAELVADPVARAGLTRGAPHPRIPAPPALFAARRNSRGLDLADESVVHRLAGLMQQRPAGRAAPMVAHPAQPPAAPRPVTNPADATDLVGTVTDAAVADVALAVGVAVAEGMAWSRVPATARAAILDRVADLIEDAREPALLLAVREAGKTQGSGVGEVREAADFCRYYALQARTELADAHALGPIACISPWNFPLAIFVGQVGAALAAGNPVLAKPAEQTPLMAAFAVSLFHAAGVPPAALQLLPGSGATVGAALVADPRVAGVLFTGSGEVARTIARTLGERDDDPVLVAETGGINAMIVDSSALVEQVVADALASAFDSAGQRCSALRVLCLQDEIAGPTITMLEGAMRELVVGDPRNLATDVGPVIDSEARDGLAAHVAAARAASHRVFSLPLPAACAGGTFFPPTLIELPDVGSLGREVFGPVLHVVRYRGDALPGLIDAINRLGYGLTHGLQTRIDETIDRVVSGVRAGNIYVNRNMIGAVVGVQPFGGERRSGTGPKAGGPHYLRRLVHGACAPNATTADVVLPGPTGETNTLTLRPRGRIACVAPDEARLLAQVRRVTGLGNVALIPANAMDERVRAAAGLGCETYADVIAAQPDAVLFAGSAEEARALRIRLADADGPIVPLLRDDGSSCDDARLVVERTITINTTATGGNASLLSLEEAQPP